MQGNSPFKLFYGSLFFTAILPYLGYIFTFIPAQFFGFNQVGWAWMFMLLITLSLLPFIQKPKFPIYFWIPWVLYLVGYLVIDFSFLGLQLTVQYTLPILIGIVASGLSYNRYNLEWLYKQFNRFIFLIILTTLYGFLFRQWLPNKAMLPMTLSLAAAIYLAIYHQFKNRKYLFLFFGLMLIPIISLTRMGILVFLVLFIAHFAENRLSRKIVYGSLGLILSLLIFFSAGFQKKTFYNNKQGSLADITLNIYEGGGSSFNSSGRSSWYRVLAPGLKENVLFGNGPRSDNAKLVVITKMKSGEAHNDYLSVRYNYGWLGIVLLFFGFTMQFRSTYLQYRKESVWYREIVLSSVLVLHLGFWLFMYSDNILKYTIFYPNLFFAMAGIAYSWKVTSGKSLQLDT